MKIVNLVAAWAVYAPRLRTSWKALTQYSRAV